MYYELLMKLNNIYFPKPSRITKDIQRIMNAISWKAGNQLFLGQDSVLARLGLGKNERHVVRQLTGGKHLLKTCGIC